MAMSYGHAPFGRFEVRAIQIFAVVFFLAVAAFAAPKSASAYYSDAAFQYIENRLPSAEITCNEGLQYYPNDQKLQMLLDRIHEAKDEQKNENKKNDKNQDQNQDNNQDQNKDQNQDQNKDQQNQDQNKDQQDQDKDQQNQDQNQDQNGENGQSSNSNAESSDSNEGGAGQQPEQQPEGESSDSNGGEEPQEQPVQMGEMSPEDAAQLLKDFDEQNGERKPWKPLRGQARPAKDW
ncbi:hypothetical protein SAMN05720487_10881 [Fibrobacter sp. UWT2]|uniref:hypothetical protein n=1 Tax=Fibrobacter sp. UWT2 TaxID=1896224 RepID=UPI0009215D24|nr:hypothetical protein [Fibrobacter sp. UWT2]SHL13286.1 hypothetical protein SAMN05720487_10881 [Fibrobacter sp. UWT2]